MEERGEYWIGRAVSWAPVIVIAATILFVYSLHLDAPWQSSLLLPVFNTVVFVMTSLVVTLVSARAFGRNGSLALLLLGAGILLFGLAIAVGAFLVDYSTVNAAVTVHNVLSLCAGGVVVAFALAGDRPVEESRRARSLQVMYVAALLGTLLVTVAATRDLLPAFATPQGTATALRFIVLWAAAGLFAAATVLLLRRVSRNSEDFLELVAIGFAVIALGLIAVVTSKYNCPLNWLGRLVQDLGLFYVLGGVLVSLGYDATNRLTRGESLAASLRRTTQALRRSEQRYQLLVEQAVDGVFLSDADGHYVDVNHAGAAMLGYTHDELCRMSIADVIVAQDVSRFPEQLSNLTARGVVTSEWTFTRKDGSIFLGEVVGRVLPDGQLLGILRDVTARKRAEEALRRSEERYRLLHETLRDGFVQVDMDGRIVDHNEIYQEMLGYSAEELAKLTYVDLTPERWHAMEQSIVEEQILPRGYSDVYAKEYRRKDGTIIPVELRTVLARSADGEPAAMWAIVRDISERVRSENALRESEGKANDLVKYAPTAIYEISFDPPRFTAVNDAMCAVTGYTREELLAMDPYELLDEPSRVLFTRRIREAQQGGLPALTVEYQVRHKDGTRSDVALNVRFARDASGRIVSAFAIGHDVTERRRLEDLLRVSAETERKNTRRLRVLADVDEVIHASRDRETVLARVVDTIAEVGDFDSVAVATRCPGGWIVEHQRGHCGVKTGFIPSEKTPLSELAAQTERVVDIEDVLDDVRTQHSCVRDAEGVRATMVVPVSQRDEIVAVVALNYSAPHRFNDGERSFGARLGSQIGLALANIELYEIEHHIAEQLQEMLVALPAELAGLRFARAYLSATYERGRVGGDFVDVFAVSGDDVGVVIGDVSGKGVEAAIVTSLVRNTVRAHAIDGLSPGKVCEKTNTIVRRFTELDVYVTMFFGLLDTKTGLLRYVSAGHPPAFVLAQQGVSGELPDRNPVVGAFDDVRYGESEAVLHAGERLILYTDGVTEARSPNGGGFFDSSGLRDTLARRATEDTAALADRVMRDVMDFSDRVLRDDAAVLVVEPTGLCS